LRILFVGDVVGRTGRNAITEHLPAAKRDWKLDLVVVNGENAAGGFGITEAIYNEFVDAGADVVTLGNHAWRQKEALVFIERVGALIRPLNFPKTNPGRGTAMIEAKNGARVLVINAQGRIFMEPLNDPFTAVDHELEACKLREGVDAIVVDFHAEATSEKQAMGHFCDGRASLVDAGMTGDYDSVIGMEKDEPLSRFLTGLTTGRYEPASGVATLSGVAVETSDATGLATKIAPVRLGGTLEQARPAFWL
jgi:calcineurin-like phosphoesterase